MNCPRAKIDDRYTRCCCCILLRIRLCIINSSSVILCCYIISIIIRPDAVAASCISLRRNYSSLLYTLRYEGTITITIHFLLMWRMLHCALLLLVRYSRISSLHPPALILLPCCFPSFLPSFLIDVMSIHHFYSSTPTRYFYLLLFPFVQSSAISNAMTFPHCEQ